MRSFIRWKLTRTSTTIFERQDSSTKRFSLCIRMSYSFAVATSLRRSANLSPYGPEEELLSKEDRRKYCSKVGEIAHLSACTRPDITFSVSFLGWSLRAPSITQRGLAKTNKSLLTSNLEIWFVFLDRTTSISRKPFCPCSCPLGWM